MATPTYLMRRNGIYYARIPVPTGMQVEVGRKEIWKGLGNRNYKDSCKLLKTVLLSDALFMIPNNEKTEILNNKAAMVAIGERQRDLSRHRLKSAHHKVAAIGDRMLEGLNHKQQKELVVMLQQCIGNIGQ